ncbi:MAG: hypothetical protein VCF24_01735, partial [Candidatus Latescibacterota bacterium]
MTMTISPEPDTSTRPCSTAAVAMAPGGAHWRPPVVLEPHTADSGQIEPLLHRIGPDQGRRRDVSVDDVGRSP